MEPLLKNEFRLWVDFRLRPQMRTQKIILEACQAENHFIVAIVTPQCLRHKIPKPYAAEFRRCAKWGAFIPILAQDALWEEVELFSNLVVLPRDGKPILKENTLDHPLVSDTIVQVLREFARTARMRADLNVVGVADSRRCVFATTPKKPNMPRQGGRLGVPKSSSTVLPRQGGRLGVSKVLLVLYLSDTSTAARRGVLGRSRKIRPWEKAMRLTKVSKACVFTRSATLLKRSSISELPARFLKALGVLRVSASY